MQAQWIQDTAIVTIPVGAFAVKAKVDYERCDEVYNWQDDSYEPPKLHVRSVEAIACDNGEVSYERRERPDWFVWLDKILARRNIAGEVC